MRSTWRNPSCLARNIFVSSKIIKEAIQKNKPALKLEFAERPPPPPSKPTQTIWKTCAWEAMKQTVEKLDEPPEEVGRMEAMGGGAPGEPQGGASLFGQLARTGFSLIKQFFGPKMGMEMKGGGNRRWSPGAE